MELLRPGVVRITGYLPSGAYCLDYTGGERGRQLAQQIRARHRARLVTRRKQRRRTT